MGKYRNFSLATYFVAWGTQHAERKTLEKDLAFFEKHLRLDKVYLEPYRDIFADDEHTGLVEQVLREHGIAVSGGITTVTGTPEGEEEKFRLFGTFCYNDEGMIAKLKRVSAFLGGHFDEFIIDDFFFTGCTCEKCRAEKESFNRQNGVTDGSWQAYRLWLMKKVSEEYVIAPAKAVNPAVKIIIKYPNWAESYQETGYAPAEQRELFDGVYTGTETRDPRTHDQHLPRYLSFSLMTYFENMCPGRNGGGWFDPFDLHITEQYLEQAYLTAFSGGRELMLFCFQALANQMETAALGFQLDRLDAVMDHAGKPIGIMCYLPDNCRGEDSAQDYLGMVGLPIVCTPYFPDQAEMILLTESAACDPLIVEKLERYVAAGGKAIVTAGFYRAAEDRGMHALSSVRSGGRKASCESFMTERPGGRGRVLTYSRGSASVLFPVPEFSNNASWALIKGMREQESYGILLRDHYGKGCLYTLALPDSFSDLYRLPAEVLSRLRAEFPVNGLWLESGALVSLFVYDNRAFIPYAYVDDGTQPQLVRIHVRGKAERLKDPVSGAVIAPMYASEDETVFEMRLVPGKYAIWTAE